MAGHETLKKILVHFQKNGSIKPAGFTECILDYFGSSGPTTDVAIELKDNRVILTSSTEKKKNEAKTSAIKIKHPSFCPLHHLTYEAAAGLPEETLNRGIDVGAVVLVHTCDGKILLTRRAAHLRTFPGIWVMPGGHIEAGESITEAGIREFREETGITLESHMFTNHQMETLAAWESVYPTKLSIGFPKRHHVVIYMVATLLPPYTSEELQKSMNLDPGEVGAAAWVDRQLIQAIVDADEEKQSTLSEADLPSHFKASVVTASGVVDDVIATSVLTAVRADTGQDIERVSTGTKFALEQWLTNNPG